jgi:hypothetical protein
MADKNKKLLDKKKTAVMKGNTKKAARIEKRMLKDSLKGMQKAGNGGVTKSSQQRKKDTKSLEYRKEQQKQNILNAKKYKKSWEYRKEQEREEQRNKKLDSRQMQTARKGRVTKSTGTGTREVDGKEYGVKYKEKVVRRKDGTVKKTVVKEQGLPTGPTGKKSPIKKSRTVKKYRSPKVTEPRSKDEASKIQKFKKEDESVLRKGGTIGYEPTAKYGKVTKASMYMSGGELKMYKKRKK